MLAFFYGDWADPDMVYADVPLAQFVAVGKVADHKFEFVRFNEDTSPDKVIHGGCMFREFPGFEVWGGVYNMSDEDWERHDKMIRIEHGRYYKKRVNVVDGAGNTYECDTYLVKNPHGSSDRTKEQVDHLKYLLIGARKLNFPEAYVKELEVYL